MFINDSKSPIFFEDEIGQSRNNNKINADEDSRKKSAVYVGFAEFKHLSSLDMYDIHVLEF